MSEKRRTGLGRGLGALIPGASSAARPVDVFFPGPATEDEQGGVSVEQREDDVAARAADGATPDVISQSPPGGTEAAAPGVEQPTAREEAPTPTDGDAVPPAVDGTTPSSPVAPAEPRGADPQGVEPEGNEPDGAVPEGAITATEPTAAPAPADPAGEDLDGLVPVPGAVFADIPVDAVVPNAQQPRQVFDEDDLEELASSIREVGVLQPVVVRRVAGPADERGESRYELIMGERRWRASKLAGNATVPAIVRDTGDDDLLRDALLENLHRVQLNPLEEAAAYQQLLDDFACTHDELAARISRSRPQISNTLRLLKLPPLVQRRVAAGVLSAGHARALLGLSDGAAMERLAQRIVAEGLSVRATEEIVALGEDEPLRPELRRRPRPGEHSGALEDLGRRLSDRWDTKVKVALGQRKGRISIEFASVQDLNRILDAVAPEDAGVLRASTGGATGTEG